MRASKQSLKERYCHQCGSLYFNLFVLAVEQLHKFEIGSCFLINFESQQLHFRDCFEKRVKQALIVAEFPKRVMGV